MLNEGVGAWFARRARMTPADTALIYEGQAFSYAHTQERITRLAHALRALGVRRGDRLAYLGANHPAFLETLFAAGTLGAIFVPLNFRLAAPELAFCLADSGSSLLVYAEEQSELVRQLRMPPELRHLIAVGQPLANTQRYDELLAGASADTIDEPVRLDEPCMIMYTSGTTGRPKGATLSHANVTWNCVNVLIDVDVGSDEVSLVSAPLFHTAALNMLCLPTFMKGGTAVLTQTFDPARTLDLIETHRVTWMFGVPAMFNAMVQSPAWPGADLSSVRLLICGGAPVPESLIRTYQARGLAFQQGYGMTETSPGALFLGRRMASKLGSAGKPSFFSDVQVVRPDFSRADVDEPGELVVRGPNVMQGYWRQEGATSAAMKGGWFCSGDIGVVDTDGFFFVRDRLKDMFISGGENVYAAEVEAAFYEHPAIAECAVVGVPDEAWGEVGSATIVLRPDRIVNQRELSAFLELRLARYKIPKFIAFAASLPRTGSGKVDKAKLRLKEPARG